MANVEAIFATAVCIAVGAAIRLFLSKVPLPYTVVILLFGTVIGFIDYEYGISPYNTFSHLNPHLLLHIFLPILIFESAFSLEVHTFMKTIYQVLILAIPGVIISMVLFAIFSVRVFLYSWSWTQGFLFGAILSATDPVAVVALLRELGVTKSLTALIEGESLLNDGSSIILFNIIVRVLKCKEFCTNTVPFIVGYFMKVAIVCPVYGYLMAKLALFWLSRIFNDAISEISITVAACYITFYIGEDLMKASGVIAVVVLGVTMSSGQTSISPEVVEFLHRFWEMLVHIANTLIFTIVGILIGRNIHLFAKGRDWFYLITLYIATNFIRLAVLIIMLPLLRKLGYGLRLNELMVTVWGGLRGAVSLSLALLVKENETLPEDFKKQVLMLVCGIVVLTLVINATTIKMILKLLGMTSVSVSRRLAMSNAIVHLNRIRDITLEQMKSDRFLADASWKLVEQDTLMTNPYCLFECEEDDLHLQELKGLVQEDALSVFVVSEVGFEALLRMVKAERFSYRSQFESGMLSADAFHKLLECSEVAIDKKGYIAVSDISTYWTLSNFLNKMKHFLQHCHEKTRLLPTNLKHIDTHWIQIFFYSQSYYFIFNFLLLLSFIETGCGIATQISRSFFVVVNPYYYYMQIFNTLFVLTLLFDVTLKLYVRGPKMYFINVHEEIESWHIFKVIAVIIGVTDTFIHISVKPQWPPQQEMPANHVLFAFEMMRMLRIANVFVAFIPILLIFTENVINKQYRIGYDVARGFYRGKEDVIMIVDHITDNENIADRIRKWSMSHQIDVIKGIGNLQRQHPGIALSVKTAQATRTVLNNMRDALTRLQEEGMLDAKEYNKLKSMIETKMKRLNLSKVSIKPPPITEILSQISWIQCDVKNLVITYVAKRVQRKSYCCNDIIKEAHIRTIGIFVIVSGMVFIQTFRDDGRVETDYKSGGCLGEFNFLSKNSPPELYVADTDVQLLLIPYEVMTKIVQHYDSEFCPIIRSMWHEVALVVAEKILRGQSRYSNCSAEDMKLLMTSAYLAETENKMVYEIPNNVSDVVLIVGSVNDDKSNVYHGPCYIPKVSAKINIPLPKPGEDQDDVIVMLLPLDSNTLAFAADSTRSLTNLSKRRGAKISFATLTTILGHLGAFSAKPESEYTSGATEPSARKARSRWHKATRAVRSVGHSENPSVVSYKSSNMPLIRSDQTVSTRVKWKH